MKKLQPPPQRQAAEVVKPRIELVSKMLKRDIEPVTYLMHGLLARGGSSLFSAPPKGLKSSLALYWSLLMIGAVECKWQRFRPDLSRPLRVGYMDLEQADALFVERMKQFAPGTISRLYRITEFPLLDEHGIGELERLITDKELDVVFLDTLARLRPSTRGRSATEADAELLAPVTKLAHRVDCHVCALVHSGKRKDHDNPLDMIAATSALAGAVDDVMVMFRPDNADNELRRHLFVTGRHIRDPGIYVLDRTQAGFELVGEAVEVVNSALQKKILEALRRDGLPRGATELVSIIGAKRQAIQRALGTLAESGYVQVTFAGKYTTRLDLKVRRKRQ